MLTAGCNFGILISASACSSGLQQKLQNPTSFHAAGSPTDHTSRSRRRTRRCSISISSAWRREATRSPSASRSAAGDSPSSSSTRSSPSIRSGARCSPRSTRSDNSSGEPAGKSASSRLRRMRRS